MGVLTVAALIFSVIAIVLWIVTFLQSRSSSGRIPQAPSETEQVSHDQNAVQSVADLPAEVNPVKEQPENEDFVNDLTKFSQMVRKNLEMINTRIGIKFDIKPLTRKSPEKTRENYVASMDISSTKPKENEENKK